jgi:exodeoxyribonuclease V beta subunit
MNPFEVIDCPLDGVNLIEASAGTGKTWTIAALYTRLLLEPGPDGEVPGIDRILVVTYTRAATAELRARLRARLRELYAVLGGAPAGDPFLAGMAAKFAEDGERQRAQARLRAAIVGFDTAAIYTIHGFCQRVLGDAAFESGQTFRAELIQDDSERLLDAVDDFWRRRIVGDALLSRLLVQDGQCPEDWLAEIRPLLGKPYLTFDRPPEVDLATARGALETCWAGLAAERETCESALQDFVACDALDGRRYGERQRHDIAHLLRDCLQTPEDVPALSAAVRDKLVKLTPGMLAQHTRKNRETPVWPVFERLAGWLEAWDAWQSAAELETTRLKFELVDWLEDELSRRREEERKRSFDDLLADLYRALDTRQGAVLARRIAESFRVALIDEFQDTDPVQYRIFRDCFVEQGRPVFLVGDPKQAIYSFRGADVFAYLAARGDTARQYTLAVNHRSQPALVDTVNALFARPMPFVLADIHFLPVDAAPGSTRLDVDDDRAACNWQWLDFSDVIDPKSARQDASKELAAGRAAEATASEIARLLALAAAGRAALVDETGTRRALDGGDMAVLVATHHQGRLVREALSALNVPSVALSQESVFASAEARDLLVAMSAWARPADEVRLRRALASELYGWDAARIAAALSDELAWSGLLAQQADDHQRWSQHGFMAAWRHFMARQQVAVRLLPLPDGERRLTNLFHLAELLQRAGDEHAGMLPLLDWFEHRVTGIESGEDALLRLESDASLVKIVTVHSAKGLQYPVVFCPFLWDGRLESSRLAFWQTHLDGESRVTPVRMAGDAVRQRARSEILAEKLRLAYVALTRARHRQYIAWGRINGMGTAALSWLLHAPEGEGLDALDAFDSARVEPDLRAFVAAQGPSASLIGSEPAPALAPRRDDTAEYRARTIDRPLFTPWRVASFSGLVHHAAGERPDHDRGRLEPPTVESEPELPPFPRGARAGTCLHAILEQVDFAAPERDKVADIVRLHGFGEQYTEAAFSLVCQTLDAPLDPGVALSRLSPDRRLVEFEFMLPVGRLSAGSLGAVLGDARHGLHPVLREAASRLDFHTVRGFLKGFVDLVGEIDGQLYLVDYKSNDLGGTPADYESNGLAASIAREHYYLQYIIYCIAIRRYFRARGVDFSARFAGVRYLYMRGLDPSGRGVWRDRPAESLLDALDALLSGGV